MIYPGIAAVFVPILNGLGIIILLLAISLYDIWAVWKSEFMKKMAEYQMHKLKFFTGFFVPYADKKQRKKIKLLRQKYKNKSDKVKENAFKKAKIKVNLAILGGGDVIFPIITAGVFYKIFRDVAGTLNGILPALIITASATLGLLYLFVLAKKGKYYPAMPFITIAMFLGMIVNWLIF
jgi:presenilin-like A22 family membrane protease